MRPLLASAVAALAPEDALRYLREHMPAFDRPNEATLFDGGVAQRTVELALAARAEYPWAASVPLDVFYEGVLPYASVNEGRSNWRVGGWAG